jgi:hypothetical protein
MSLITTAFLQSILRTVFETEAETLILPLAFDLTEKAETRILPLVIENCPDYCCNTKEEIMSQAIINGDLSVTNNVAVGPFTVGPLQGQISVTGSFGEFSFLTLPGLKTRGFFIHRPNLP